MDTMVAIITIALLAVGSNVLSYKLGRFIEHDKMYDKVKTLRKKLDKYENFSTVPIGAANAIAKYLYDDREEDRQAPFVYNALVTVKDEKISVQDFELIRKDDSKPICLSEFCRDDRYVDEYLMDASIIEAICTRLRHDVINDLEAYPKFNGMMNDIKAGKYSYIDNNFDDVLVVSIPLCHSDLNIIANLDNCGQGVYTADQRKARKRENKRIALHNEIVQETDDVINGFKKALEDMAVIERRAILLRNLVDHFNDPDFPSLIKEKNIQVVPIDEIIHNSKSKADTDNHKTLFEEIKEETDKDKKQDK